MLDIRRLCFSFIVVNAALGGIKGFAEKSLRLLKFPASWMYPKDRLSFLFRLLGGLASLGSCVWLENKSGYYVAELTVLLISC